MLLNKNLFYTFIIFDILFLPFLKPLPVISSMILVIYWFFVNHTKILRDKRFLLILVILFFAIISVVYAFFKIPGVVFYDGVYANRNIDNFITLSLLFIFFMYFIFFKLCSSPQLHVLVNLLMYYLFFNFFLAIIFWLDYQLFFSVRNIWTFGSASLEVGEFSSITRFTGVFSDPNNASVAVVAVYSFLMICRFSVKKFVVLSFITLFVVISTMSSTGAIAYSFAFFSLVIYSIFFYKVRVFYVFYLLLFLLIFIFSILASDFFKYLEDFRVVATALDRFENNSADSRLQKIWLYFSSDELLYTFLVGQGGSIFLDGISNKPHIGHLHLMFNYGLYSWLIFLFVFFMIRFNRPLALYLPVFIIFIGFSVNTAIIDFRFALLSALLLGAYHSSFFVQRTRQQFVKDTMSDVK